jgi:hypothetical protein
MKKLLVLLTTIWVSVSAFGQNGKNEVLPAPASSSPYFLIDTTFIQGSKLEDTTVVYVHFNNPTSNKITGIQVRFFYDNVNFKTPIVKWGPVATAVSSKYGAYYSSSDWVNVNLIYTGNSSTFGWSNGAIFMVKLPHKSTFDPATVDSLMVTGTTTYNNLATTSAGIDVSLGMFSYGGAFLQPTLKFPFIVKNVQNGATKGITAKYHYKKKAASTWSAGTSFRTDSTGKAIIEIPYDTSYYNVKLTIATDSLKDGSAISIVDAYRLADIAVQSDTATSYEYQEGDINRSGTLTTSDAFLVFNRLAKMDTTWNALVSGEHNVKLLRKTEYDSIVATPSTFLTSKVGVYTIDKSINGLDSLKYHSYVLGDVTSTGYNTTSFLVAKIAQGGSGTQYVLDQQRMIQHIDDSVQFVIPKLNVSGDNTATIPVTLVTHGNSIGAAQIGLEFDTNIFEFESLDMGETMSRWTSFLANQDGKILWGGHESQMDPALVTGTTNVFTFKFKIKSTNWEESPIRVFSKAAGDETASDLNIIRTPVDATVVYRRGKSELLDELVDGFRAFPNPATDYILVDYYMAEQHKLSSGLFTLDGQLLQHNEVVNQGGVTSTKYDLTKLPTGVYVLMMSTDTKTKFYKIVKY